MNQVKEYNIVSYLVDSMGYGYDELLGLSKKELLEMVDDFDQLVAFSR